MAIIAAALLFIAIMGDELDNSLWNNKRVLIAGGAGMIGSYLVENLLADGASVRVADNLESGSLENLSSCISEIEFLELDLREAEACRRSVAGMDVVFDLAAKTVGIQYSAEHHGEMLCHTTMIAMNLLEAARLAGVRRYMVTSSSCVYPDGATVPTPEEEGNQGTPESANQGYGWAKRFAEIQAKYYVQEYGMQIAVVRPANVYGRRYNWKQQHAHVIPALIFRILSGECPLVVWGSGRQSRSFIHAHDAARAMQLMTEKAADGNPVNLGGQEITIAEVVKKLTGLAGYQGDVVFDISKPEGPARKAQSSDRLLNVAPGFKHTVSFDDGLFEMIEAVRAYIKNPTRDAAGAAVLA